LEIQQKNSAFFINGGAGRVISSIPALELYRKETPDDDFIIVCEAGMDVFRGHPELHKRAYEPFHKGLFDNYIKMRKCVSLEPYRVWEYYNQKCSIAQAFDIEINNKGIRDLQPPSIFLSSDELNKGFLAVKEIKETLKCDKAIVFQPFGRSTQVPNGFAYDSSGRSFDIYDAVEIIKKLQKKKIAVIFMSEFDVPFQDLGCDSTPRPQNVSVRDWMGIINSVDHFLGCDSLGQHLAYSLNKSATVVLGSTFPINVSYPTKANINIIDIDAKSRKYSPIRITMDDEIDRQNDKCMKINKNEKIIADIVKSVCKGAGIK
jgi:hypothetical protein